MFDLPNLMRGYGREAQRCTGGLTRKAPHVTCSPTADTPYFHSLLGQIMSRQCELTGKGGLVGHLVSHSNIKTKRRYLPNLCNVTLLSDSLGRGVRMRISANALRSVEHRGGLDAFLLKAKDEELSLKARRLKREVVKARTRVESENAA